MGRDFQLNKKQEKEPNVFPLTNEKILLFYPFHSGKTLLMSILVTCNKKRTQSIIYIHKYTAGSIQKKSSHVNIMRTVCTNIDVTWQPRRMD